MKYPAGSKQIQTGFSCFLTFKLLLFVSLSISVHICRGHTFDTITLEIIEITTHQWMITTHQWYVIQNRMLSQNGTPHYVDSRNTDKQDIQRRLRCGSISQKVSCLPKERDMYQNHYFWQHHVLERTLDSIRRQEFESWYHLLTNLITWVWIS